MNAKEMFDELKKYEGQEIKCYYWHYGNAVICDETLEKVEYYRGIECKGQFIPFVGYGCAIVGIKLKSNGKTIFYNPNIEEQYDRRDQNEIEKAKVSLFGPEVVFKQRRRRIAREQKAKMEREIANQQAKLKKPILIEKGLKYILEDLREDWIKHVTVNTEDAYSCAVVELSVEIMEALYNGADKEKINKILCDRGASGYSASYAIKTVLHFTNLFNQLALPTTNDPKRTLHQ